MGDWIYYVSSMQFREIRDRVKATDEIHTSSALNELIQRKLTDRSSDIATYLCSQPQRFFNAVILGVYGGEPDWLEVALDATAPYLGTSVDPGARHRIDSTLGLLRLAGDEKLFAIDGQHRVAAIKRALEIDPSLEREELAVVFVGHSATPAGNVRTRRLFSTLNRYAKPVSKGEIVALDEDDAFAITARRLVDEHPLLCEGRAYGGKQTGLLRSDKTSFTSILTVYDICGTLAEGACEGWSRQKLTRSRPEESTLEGVYAMSSDFWHALGAAFPAIAAVRDAPAGSPVAGEHRTDAGGHLLFRPIGQMAFARAIRILRDTGITTPNAVSSLAGLPFELSQQPWTGLLWNPVSHTMQTAQARRDVAARLMLRAAGHAGDEGKLLVEYRKVTGAADAQLPQV